MLRSNIKNLKQIYETKDKKAKKKNVINRKTSLRIFTNFRPVNPGSRPRNRQAIKFHKFNKKSQSQGLRFFIGSDDKIRTCDPRLMSPVL